MFANKTHDRVAHEHEPPDLANGPAAGAPRVLIVDDEVGVRSVLSELLRESCECVTAASAEEALGRLGSESFHLVLSDINMPGVSGLQLASRVRELAPDAVVIMVSAERHISAAVGAMRAGAFDYVSKPFDFDQVEAAVRRALDYQAVRAAKRRYEFDLEALVRRRTEELDRLSYRDQLTNLPNRQFFENRLAQALSRAAGGGRAPTVMLLGLDRLKTVNETLGYVVGDQLLREIAARLEPALRDVDTVARWGGSEFALLLRERAGRQKDAVRIAREVREALARPFAAGGRELHLSASVGISSYPHDGRNAPALMKNASAALRRAAQDSGFGLQFYAAEMNAAALDRLVMEGELRRALERGEFALHYQPRVSVADGRVLGAEALVRWRHPERGLVPPSDFIPVAEETGLILPLGEWVLREACAQLAAWRAEGLPPFAVSVNVSARQLRQPGLARLVGRVVEESGVEPASLELELTESSVMEDAEFAVGVLSGLRAGGVRVAIDDFGTGYSSLGYLKRLPVDALKIDRSFVRDSASRDEDRAIISGIIGLAQALRLRVVAEGVEEEGQLRLLRELGCDEAQGYFFSRPLPPDELSRLIGEGMRS